MTWRRAPQARRARRDLFLIFKGLCLISSSSVLYEFLGIMFGVYFVCSSTGERICSSWVYLYISAFVKTIVPFK